MGEAGCPEASEYKTVVAEDGKLRRVPVCPEPSPNPHHTRIAAGVLMTQAGMWILDWGMEIPRWIFWAPIWMTLVVAGLLNIMRGLVKEWAEEADYGDE